MLIFWQQPLTFLFPKTQYALMLHLTVPATVFFNFQDSQRKTIHEYPFAYFIFAISIPTTTLYSPMHHQV